MKKRHSLFCLLLCSIAMHANIVTGSCGDDLTYQYDTDTKVLSILGSGAMTDYDDWNNKRPWYQVRSSILSVNISKDVTNIGSSAFSGCSSLTSINIPNGVTSIGSSAFSGCSSLTSITIPNGVTSIGSSAFSGCSSLTSITIPNGVTSIGSSAFQDCENITSITIPSSITKIESYTFSGCRGLTAITIPEGVTHIDSYAFDMYVFLPSITIPASVTSIGYKAFTDCSLVYMRGIIPPTIDSGSFASDAVVYVPCAAFNDYVQAPVWQFLNIQGSTNLLHIAATDGGNAKLAAYDCDSRDATIEATANDNYKFIKWSDGNTDNPRTLTVSNETNLIAEFAEIPYYNVTLEGINLSGWYESINYFGGTDKNNFWYENSQTFSVREGLQVYFKESGSSCNGQTWLSWSDGNTEQERTIVVTSDTLIRSRFDVQTYHVRISAGAGGALENGDVDKELTECNNLWLSVCAKANDGYYFVTWSDGNQNACREFHISQDTTVFAEFAQKEQVQVLVGVDNGSRGMGSVSGSGIYYSGDVTSIHAKANAGYHFVEWSDGNGFADRELALSGDTTLFAVFATGNYGGKCGADLYWTWQNDTLRITGCGNMDLKQYQSWLWYAQSGTYLTTSSISFPTGLTGIYDNAFNNDTFARHFAFTEVHIPASVTYIGTNAFKSNNNLQRFECQGDKVWNIGNGILEDCYNLRYFKGVSSILSSCPSNVTDSVIITNGSAYEQYISVPYIDNSKADNWSVSGPSVSGVKTVRALILPEGLRQIGNYALYNARYLGGIVIPQYVREIGASAFEDCRMMDSVVFAGNELEIIGDWAFYNCHNLKQIALPQGLQEIGTAAFYGCTFLSDLTIPSTTQKIAENAFALCTKMRRMHVNALVPPVIKAKTFEDVDRSIPVFVPKGTLERYQGDRYWSEFFNITEYDAPTGILNASAQGEDNASKVLRKGQVLIIRGDQTYTVLGEKL